MADVEAIFVCQTGRAVNHDHAIFLHQIGDALTQFVGHRAAVLYEFVDIKTEIVDGEAKMLGCLDSVGNVGAMQQRLGGYAAPIQTDAPEVLFFYKRRFETQLSGANSGDITAGTATHYHEVIVLHR